MREITVTTTAKQLPQNNDIIGWKGGNNRAAQAAPILIHFFDALYKTTTWKDWRFWQQRGNTTVKDLIFLAWIQNHSCSSGIFRTQFAGQRGQKKIPKAHFLKWHFRSCSHTKNSQGTSRRLRKIIDQRDTEKSRYFPITEFNNHCFIIRSLFLWST